MIHPEQNYCPPNRDREGHGGHPRHGNQYYFHVVPEANRVTVKQAIEKQFSVDVQKVTSST